ncbi:MAG: radical SAM protein, partial [Oscillospiraceae bacterium]|nr:radical SAM protein [Oscillospiraceae bacterium]
MSDRTIKESLEAFGLKKVVAYLDNDPDANIPKVLRWVEKLDRDGSFQGQLSAARNAVEHPDGNWYKLIKSAWTDLDAGVRRAMFENFIINASVIGCRRQEKFKKENDCNVPWAILMDPTSACNLHCIGCWAAEYGNKLNMSFETLDSIVRQGTEMGVFFYIFSGGEPLVRKKDIIRLCEAHPSCVFLSFTNGTLIDEEFADEMLRVKNFVPAISVEGFEEETDSRRGAGTYAAVARAMEILKRKKLAFGISCCYTSKNAEIIGSEEYFDDMIAKGAKFAWLFTYMPVGAEAV